eukprot:TRINITY_DN5321_c0_g1_i1.p1 TRINITY_DN5321_c0_g1~~TRINITY_DN5321_c0_g1_i1.p1  ORF type:complete len:423 (-),score=140.90 TRINITY_DN5321_c0_g1_i1:31-1299(-)
METNSVFAVNIKLEEALECIKNCREFKVTEIDDLVYINYRFCNKSTFPDPETAKDEKTKRLWHIKRECRGIIFFKETGLVAARRFHKFFNIGESDETAEEKIDLSQPHTIVTKYDGTLVSPVKTKGNVIFASKSGDNNIKKIIEERYLLQYEDKGKSIYDFCDEWINKGCTPLFEWCSLRTRIVLEYENDLLVLLAIRENVSGNYIPYNEVVNSAKNFKNVFVAERWNNEGGKIDDIKEWMKNIKSEEKIEGFVIQFNDGRMYKVKTEWYFERTRKDKQEYSFNSERNIWNIILKQEIDDAAPYMDTKLKNSVENFSVQLYKKIEELSDWATEYVKKYAHMDKKDFVSHCHKNVPANPFGVEGEEIKKDMEKLKPLFYELFARDGDFDALEATIEWVLKLLTNQKTFYTIQRILGNIKFIEN